MKIRPTLLAALLPCATWCVAAPAPAAAPGPDARALGMAEAYQRYCVKVDPQAAASLQQQVDRLALGTPADAMAGIRARQAYRKAYDSVTDFVAKVDARNARKPCAQALALHW